MNHGVSLLFWYKRMKYLSLFDSSRKIRDYFFHYKGAHVMQKAYFYRLVYKQHYSFGIHSSYFSNTRPNFWGRFFSNPRTLNEGLLQGNSAQRPPFWWSWEISHFSNERLHKVQAGWWWTVNEAWHAWESKTITILIDFNKHLRTLTILSSTSNLLKKNN